MKRHSSLIPTSAGIAAAVLIVSGLIAVATLPDPPKCQIVHEDTDHDADLWVEDQGARFIPGLPGTPGLWVARTGQLIGYTLTEDSRVYATVACTLTHKEPHP